MVTCFIVPPALELVHIGKKEIQQRIDSMEAAYSQPITWSASADSAVPSSQWEDNILVVGDTKRQSGSKVKSLIANSFGFASNGELHNVSGYLKSHGGFELEMVGSSFSTFGMFILMVFYSEYSWNLVRICPFHFKVEGNGNCLFSAIKKSLQIRRSGVAGSRDGDRDLPYYPTQYFHHQVVNWMVENRQKVFVYMDSALRATPTVLLIRMYSMEVPSATEITCTIS